MAVPSQRRTTNAKRQVNFQDYQDQVQNWITNNYPAYTPSQAALHVCEEAGELARAQLKLEQGVRGTADHWRTNIQEEVGDILNALVAVCMTNNLVLKECAEQASKKLDGQNWLHYPINGRDL